MTGNDTSLDAPMPQLTPKSIAENERLRDENVQLHAKVLALEEDAARAESSRKKQFQAAQQEIKELRVKYESLQLRDDDLKPKVRKLQAVVQRGRQTREAFVHRWQEIKHLRKFNHKEQQLLTALAKIAEDELQEN